MVNVLVQHLVKFLRRVRVLAVVLAPVQEFRCCVVVFLSCRGCQYQVLQFGVSWNTSHERKMLSQKRPLPRVAAGIVSGIQLGRQPYDIQTQRKRKEERGDLTQTTEEKLTG